MVRVSTCDAYATSGTCNSAERPPLHLPDQLRARARHCFLHRHYPVRRHDNVKQGTTGVVIEGELYVRRLGGPDENAEAALVVREGGCSGNRHSQGNERLACCHQNATVDPERTLCRPLVSLSFQRGTASPGSARRQAPHEARGGVYL